MATTSKALRELEAQGLWLLPKPLFSGPRQWNPIRLSQPVPLPTDVPELVQDLRGLRLLLVEDQEHQRIWNEFMNRFLIRPSVRCANLASRILGLCCAEVATNFERRYGLRPWLLESFVETPTHEGCCYKAANWICVG